MKRKNKRKRGKMLTKIYINESYKQLNCKLVYLSVFDWMTEGV